MHPFSFEGITFYSILTFFDLPVKKETEYYVLFQGDEATLAEEDIYVFYFDKKTEEIRVFRINDFLFFSKESLFYELAPLYSFNNLKAIYNSLCEFQADPDFRMPKMSSLDVVLTSMLKLKNFPEDHPEIVNPILEPFRFPLTKFYQEHFKQKIFYDGFYLQLPMHEGEWPVNAIYFDQDHFFYQTTHVNSFFSIGDQEREKVFLSSSPFAFLKFFAERDISPYYVVMPYNQPGGSLFAFLLDLVRESSKSVDLVFDNDFFSNFLLLQLISHYINHLSEEFLLVPVVQTRGFSLFIRFQKGVKPMDSVGRLTVIQEELNKYFFDSLAKEDQPKYLKKQLAFSNHKIKGGLPYFQVNMPASPVVLKKFLGYFLREIGSDNLELYYV